MKVGFIYNPKSGQGKIEKHIEWIKEEFFKASKELILLPTEKSLDATKFVLENKDLDMLLVAGGDGTLSEVINGVMELDKKPYIGYIPTGTVNDVGRMLGMKKAVKKTVKMILAEETIRAIDISKINDRYFVYALAAGKFSNASYAADQEVKKKVKRLAYFFVAVKDLFKKYRMPAKVTHDNGTIEGVYALILILNGFRVGGFNLKPTKQKLNSGVLYGRFFKQRPFSFLHMIWFFLTGGFFDRKRKRVIESTYFKIETEGNIQWGTDGEKSFVDTIEIRHIPKAVKFVVNSKIAKKMFSEESKDE